ncbi:protein saal1 [Capsicum galapagoense]
MSIPPESEYQSSTHHPPAPSDELFDITTTVDPSYIISLIRKLLPENVKHGDQSCCIDKSENMKNVETFFEQSVDDKLYSQNEREGVAAGEGAWEEFGCILWDLAASKTHAEFMVENFTLEVLLATLMVSKSSRITEISLGIIGNLACHDVPRKKITSTNGLIGAVLQQLFLDDTPCLCEACRLLTLFLPSDESVFLAEALQPEQILSRILWIVENTLNVQLLEKSINLLLAIAESKQDVVAILLPPLFKLGLLRILVDLLSVEISKLMEERSPERCSILDLILQTIEALSVIDDYSQEICSNKELFQLLVQLIKHPDKAEFAHSCVTASVLTANILTDATYLALEISQDRLFLQGLVDVFPFASDDIEARSAIWSILARLLARIQKTDMSPSDLHQHVSVLTSKSEVVEDELLNYNVDDSSEDHRGSTKLISRTFALNRIVEILSQWRTLDDHLKETLSMEGCYVSERDVDKMLHYCCKYAKSTAGTHG